MEEVSQKWKGTCPTLLSIAGMHTITKSSMGTKGLLWLIGYHQGKPGQELKAGTWRQKLKQRPWKNAAYWLAPHALLTYFLVQPRPTCPEIALLTGVCTLLCPLKFPSSQMVLACVI